MINLPYREDRRRLVTAELERFGQYDYSFWSATHRENGVVGLLDTMRSVFRHCIEQDFPSVMILEDDVKFIEDIAFAEKSLMDVPVGFDMLYLGCNLSQEKVDLFCPGLIKLTGAYATHAIIYSRAGMRKALTMLENFSCSPYDVQLVHGIQTDGNCYGVMPMVATQGKSFSDITKTETDYAPFLEQRFEKKTQSLR